ncbi:hypothetical protein B0O99DRAFT_62072 [Bisporella sp. PMI_857]|nr:hypothetical protein B0O99DRAFT_62072 [Bisporella sp. PMI_857]
MYIWYRQAHVCIAFLNDFEHRESRGNPHLMADFESCKRFTCGWTVHALLAPKRVGFYNCDWHKVGGRTETWLMQLLMQLGFRLTIHLTQSPKFYWSESSPGSQHEKQPNRKIWHIV